jgi:enoyl-CoA hydratase/carnithine racemase
MADGAGSLEFVRYERVDSCAMITLNRPERRNALGAELCNDLRIAYQRFEADEGALAAVITGEGAAFCAGRDVKETIWSDGEPHDVVPPPRDLYYDNNLSKPVIGAVNGYAYGGGMILALCFCDLLVSTSSALFEMSEVQRSLLRAWDIGWNLGLPRHTAMEVALGYRLTGRRLHELGIVNEIVDDISDLVPAALRRGEHFAGLSQAIVRGHRELVRAQAKPVMAPEVAERWLELKAAHELTPDFDEGDKAFLEKRAGAYRDAEV